MRTVLLSTCTILAATLLSGCGGNTSVIEKQDTRYVVTAVSDERESAIADVKTRATEYCEEQDHDRYEIIDQQIQAPNDAADNSGEKQLEGATVSEDTELSAATHEGDGYKVSWTIRCQ
ncbi:hypothetical protein [Phytohalomonas tamaricis]|uniref:hypothetical protein n=1 Tax=Phytohalomonas tamaricis TaxID=2081032 RepID=UPI001319CB8C|nr:hypothetical protein [Phytohalomonas tamaricis]